MGLTQPPPLHPAEYSPEVLEVLVELFREYGVTRVHDPFAGRGARLGGLCDELGITFTATDIERYRDSDPRVGLGDSTRESSYPAPGFTVATSPVYFNRISTDYVNGPTPETKVNGRRSYGISLGRALDHRNLARAARYSDKFYVLHGEAVKHWGDLVMVNVDEPMFEAWESLLREHGYLIPDSIAVKTRRYRGPANSDKRAPHEVVIVAEREAGPE